MTERGCVLRARVAVGLGGWALGAILAGCAAGPEHLKDTAYDAYWQCASVAVRPYLHDVRLPAREAALRAQARCNPHYDRFRRAQVAVVQSRIPHDDSGLADQLGDQQALVWRRRVTHALTAYVLRIRDTGA